MLKGIEIEKSENEKGQFTGVVTKLNDNKYVQMFIEKDNKLVSGIKRCSNFEFVISDIKTAALLISAFGQSTVMEFKATLKGKDKILLGKIG
ncbi:hypothetical protein [Xanthovirga aplysinae]|uniref:hypothetical protein n=1 Tax=Xanthovirga aplysinae TaxID=2529853 RepID=UPI0012BD78FE|nr:hypothetical protein [Xanthovirga aplysinae]MTI32373.1 hypothetical protein [Xanthovirga aplysinae]